MEMVWRNLFVICLYTQHVWLLDNNIVLLQFTWQPIICWWWWPVNWNQSISLVMIITQLWSINKQPIKRSLPYHSSLLDDWKDHIFRLFFACSLIGLVVVVDWNWNSRLIHCSLSVVYHATLSIYSYRNSIFWYSFERNAKCENNSMLFSTFNFVWIKKQRCLPSSRPYSVHIHFIRKESQAIFQFASPTSYNIQLHSGIIIIKQSIVARIITILDKCVMSFIQC